MTRGARPALPASGRRGAAACGGRVSEARRAPRTRRAPAPAYSPPRRRRRRERARGRQSGDNAACLLQR
eukprot:scaffold77612_cov66-Phaeocystis_antarctica.AAC.1